jgi:hypothetical protein
MQGAESTHPDFASLVHPLSGKPGKRVSEPHFTQKLVYPEDLF